MKPNETPSQYNEFSSWRGTWTAIGVYDKGEAVYYAVDGSCYVCLQYDVTGTAPGSDPLKWGLLASGHPSGANVPTGGDDGDVLTKQSATDWDMDWETPGAASHPDLAAHDAMGLSTDTELSTHAGAADPHTVYQKESEKGQANGYASLDASGDVPDAQIPAAIARDSEVTGAITTHEGAGDPHTGYELEADHTKAAHDALGIDADTVDTKHASDFATSSHTHGQLHDEAHAKEDHNGAVIPGSADEDLGPHYLEVDQMAAPANPAAGSRRVYMDSTTGKLSVRTSAGASVSLEEQGGTPDWSIIDAKGDLIVGTANDTVNRQPVGTNGQVLVADSNQSTGVKWDNAPAGTPSSTVESETTFGISPAAGSATDYSRGDHTHGSPTNPVTAHEAAGDPHTGYRLESADHSHQSTGLQAGQLDHGLALTGLGDDDHPQYQLESEKGVANGYASLDGSGDVPDSQIPDGIARDSEVTSAIGTHEAAGDPHAGYELESAHTKAAHDALALSHDSLADVSANDHHNESHDSGAHTGSVLTGMYDEDLGNKRMDIGQISTPSNPASGVRRLFVDSADGKLKVRTNAGASVSLEEQGGGGTPSDTVEAETTFGISSAAGSASSYSRGDHTHGSPTDPVTAHEAAGDPHTGYRLESADHSHASTGMEGGQVAHSALTGLTTGDDHTQYQKESEKDAASGYAGLDGSTLLSGSQVPATHAGSAHHAQQHGLESTSDHSLSGATSGEFLRATGATTWAVEAVPFTKGGTLLDPSGAINVIVWRAPFACTVTNVRGYRVGGTGATINARKNGTSNHLSSALSLTSADTWMDGGSVQNTSYAAGDKLEIMVVSVTGTPTQVAVQVDFTRP